MIWYMCTYEHITQHTNDERTNTPKPIPPADVLPSNTMIFIQTPFCVIPMCLCDAKEVDSNTHLISKLFQKNASQPDTKH